MCPVSGLGCFCTDVYGSSAEESPGPGVTIPPICVVDLTDSSPAQFRKQPHSSPGGLWWQASERRQRERDKSSGPQSRDLRCQIGHLFKQEMELVSGGREMPRVSKDVPCPRWGCALSSPGTQNCARLTPGSPDNRHCDQWQIVALGAHLLSCHAPEL